MSDVSVVNVEGTQITAVSASMGVQGPRGLDLSYEHTQGVAASLWVVAHGLGKRPSVTVVDSAGDQVEGSVTYLNLNNLRIEFSAPFSGEAFLN